MALLVVHVAQAQTQGEMDGIEPAKAVELVGIEPAKAVELVGIELAKAVVEKLLWKQQEIEPQH